MGVGKKRRPAQSLTAGRPPLLKKPKSMSRKSTRALINGLHTLEKRKKQAVLRGDKAAEASITEKIADLGGIEGYQLASLQGQRNDRGGDSSRVLLEWLEPIEPALRARSASSPLRLLEVGALSCSNACSKSGMFDIERIDLNSQESGIKQQDFMDRPLPEQARDRFHVISLSLVLNFVPEPRGRGAMLLRTLDFLHAPWQDAASPLASYLPCLFLVLPAPCVQNSRYLDDKRLRGIMSCLGYELAKSKLTQKLAYYLWARVAGEARVEQEFVKDEIRSGPRRNNFAIVLGPRP